MRRDSRLSVALHVLLHMQEHGEAVSSEALAEQMAMNAVVLRRTMAGLRDAGIVRSEKGHGGGWALVRPLARITLADVYAALGEPELFAIGARVESPGCRVEQAVNRALEGALAEAQALVTRRLASITLADVAKDVRDRGGLRRKKAAHSHA